VTLGNWILASGIWLGFKTASSARANLGVWVCATVSGLGLVWFLDRATVSAHTVATWWIACGLFLAMSAWRALKQRSAVGWSDFIEMIGEAIGLGFGTGLWIALGFGMAIGALLSVSFGHQARLMLDRLSSLTVGAVGLNDLWAGLHGNLPAHHLSWIWAVPWLMAGEYFVIVSDDRPGWPAKRSRAKPRWPRKGGFAR